MLVIKLRSDLHIHTLYSDGELDEYQIIKEIEKAELDEFSICDHDTIEGSKKVFNLIAKENVKAIFHSGVELSSRYKDVNIHLLVRDFNLDDENMKYLIDKINRLRKQRTNFMLEFVERVYGINIDRSKVKEIEDKTNSFGKPHLYKILLTYGDFKRDEYYKNMDRFNCDNFKLDAIEVFEKLKNREGYITLAHPVEIMREYNLSYEDIDNLVGELVECGLKGLETKHSNHTNKDYLVFSKIAKKYKLIETTGSDFHGEGVKPGLKIGMFEKR